MIGSLESCLLRFFKALTCFDFINALKLCHNMQFKENSVGSGLQRFSGIIKLNPEEFVTLFSVLLKPKIKSVIIYNQERIV